MSEKKIDGRRQKKNDLPAHSVDIPTSFRKVSRILAGSIPVWPSELFSPDNEWVADSAEERGKKDSKGEEIRTILPF